MVEECDGEGREKVLQNANSEHLYSLYLASWQWRLQAASWQTL